MNNNFLLENVDHPNQINFEGDTEDKGVELTDKNFCLAAMTNYTIFTKMFWTNFGMTCTSAYYN